MEKIVICGQKPLYGTIDIAGMKNAAIPIILSTILTEDKCVIENLPDISDVNISLQILESIGVKVLNVSVEQEGDKVYYVFRGTHYGCTAEDLQFFDGTKVYDLITEFDDTNVTFKIDVTSMPAGTQIWPHLKVKGVNYYNGGHNNEGDIVGSDVWFVDNQSITYNGLVYKIKRDWSMPSLVISEVE